MGTRDGFGSGNHWDLVLKSAGGTNAITGDYLYESLPIQENGVGIWGLFRVQPPAVALKAAPAAAVPAPQATARQAPPVDPAARFLRPRDKDEKAIDIKPTATPEPPQKPKP